MIQIGGPWPWIDLIYILQGFFITRMPNFYGVPPTLVFSGPVQLWTSLPLCDWCTSANIFIREVFEGFGETLSRVGTGLGGLELVEGGCCEGGFEFEVDAAVWDIQAFTVSSFALASSFFFSSLFSSSLFFSSLFFFPSLFLFLNLPSPLPLFSYPFP